MNWPALQAILSDREHAILLPELPGPFWIQDCDPEVMGCEGERCHLPM
jgi:hypothetical protein